MEIELGRVFRAIRRFWWVVVASMVAFGLLASLLWTALPKSYTASSTVLVLPTDITGVALTADGVPVQTYLGMIESDSVLSFVIEDLGLDMTLGELRENIVASNIPGTSMILIQVSDPDSQQAADISNAVVTSFNARAESLVRGVIQEKRDNLVFERNQIDVQLITINSRTEQLTDEDVELSSEDQSELEQLQDEKVRLEQRRADLNQTIRNEENTLATMQAPVSVSETASPPDDPEGLSVVLMSAVGVVLGALVGAGLMLWLELRDPYVRDERHVRELLMTDSVTRISGSPDSIGAQSSVKLAAARVAGIVRSANASTVLFVSPRESESVLEVADLLRQSAPLVGTNVVTTNGLLDTGVDIEGVISDSTAMVFVEPGKTRNQDVLEVVEVLRDLGVFSISTTILEK